MIDTISDILVGKKSSTPPRWLMRQAGRYLPEYQKTRALAGSFLDLCFNPSLAMEVTLQPLRRFDLSAAIIFSDILLIPQSLGMGLSFTDNMGPKLDTSQLDAILTNGFSPSVAEKMLNHLAPVLKAITLTKEKILTSQEFANKDLIGFAGAPFTLFCYMVSGQSSHDFAKAIDFARRRPDDFRKIIAILTEAVIVLLKKQREAGADIVKLFDSWAGLAPADIIDIAIHEPHQKIISAMDRLIVFPRGHQNIMDYHAKTKARVIALDQGQDMPRLAKALPDVIFQGNLDPMLLKKGGDDMISVMKKFLTNMAGQSYIFNLGHGIDKDTPPNHVTDLIHLIKNFHH